jgi:2-polyprenyl-6-methoxyphenol hydroxylase-like FAD-dependent oxidoreductase
VNTTLSTEHVLIIGAGPAGLFAAGELARHGVNARLVERQATPHKEARATAIQPAVLEVLGRAGVLEPFLQIGMPIRCVRIIGPALQEIGASTLDEIDCPHTFECALPQWRTERILTEHLEALGGTVERGVQVTAIEEAHDKLAVTLRHADGQVERLSVDYLLGAGGAHSITRSSMHESLEGSTYGGQFVAAEVQTGLPMPRDEARLFVGPKGLVLLAPLPDQHWIMFVSVDEETTTPPDEAGLNALVSKQLGRDAGIHDVGWASCFRMHCRVAPRLAEGRRFLLGDAGHLSSPIAGEGLNSALMDAADVAWKLALVLRGAARPTLLDSYAIERSLADHQVIKASDAAHQQVMALVTTFAEGRTLAQDAPDAARDLAVKRSRAMLDLSYAGSPLVGEHLPAEAPADPASGTRFPDRTKLAGTGHHLLVFGPADLDRLRERWTGTVEILDGIATGFDAARAGVPTGGAVLVRPDGIIGFRLSQVDGPGLAALDAHLTRYLIPHEPENAA